MKKMKKYKLLLIIIIFSLFCSCGKYLDIVPDNIATIENAFTSRAQAEKYLFTCYSFLPREDDPEGNPGFHSGDEFWSYWPLDELSVFTLEPYNIARGLQNKVNPNLNFWDGGSRSPNLWQGIRACNIFLENVEKVLDLEPYMKTRWIAEAKFLKAYYHWYLFRMYGPIPIVDKNLPISATTSEVRVKRQPVDSVVNYIANLIDSAAIGDANTGLPNVITNQGTELGRITKPIALSIKARLLVTAASPLFNGNQDFSNYFNIDGKPLFNAMYDASKWQRAAIACKTALEACSLAKIKLYQFNAGLYAVDKATQIEMSIRNAVCEKWNNELIWGNTPGTGTLQNRVCTNFDPNNINNGVTAQTAPSFKMAELFYTNNGVPIDEDKTWDYANRFNLRIATNKDSSLQNGYTTVGLHFDREPRFYADMGFDGAKLFMGNGTWDLQTKRGQISGMRQSIYYSITGYLAKKLINWKLIMSQVTGANIEPYPWPIVRLGDLYLLYAEALNESDNSSEALTYLNQIRDRAGLKSIESSWTTYSTNPTKYTTKEGLRTIIHQERLIEMAFETSRFWDLRRWKKAATTLNAPIVGWNVTENENISYYRKVQLFNQHFVSPRDYFWPIKDYDITVNPDLVQNLGW